jgi:phosphomannomutase
MVNTLCELRKKAWVAVVGGSDQRKILEQLGGGSLTLFDFLFSENGLVAVKNGVEVDRKQLTNHFSVQDRKRFESFCWKYIKTLVLPKKCSHHVETRTGMWNISPIGRDCTQEERKAFEVYDNEHKVRERMVTRLKEEFASMNLSFVIGGEISFDVYPNGWDKTYCLPFLSEYKHVHFFGDKTFKGGNDFDIYTSMRTIGHQTTGPNVTIKLIQKVFNERESANYVEAAVRDILASHINANTIDFVVGYLNYFFASK